MVLVRRQTLFAVTINCLVRVGAHTGGDEHPHRTSPPTTSHLQPEPLLRKEPKQIASHDDSFIGTSDTGKHKLEKKTSAEQPHGFSAATDSNHKANNGGAKRIPTAAHHKDPTSFKKGSSHHIHGKPRKIGSEKSHALAHISTEQLQDTGKERAPGKRTNLGMEESINRTKSGKGHIKVGTSNTVAHSESTTRGYVEVSKEEAHAICPGYFGIHTGNSSLMRCYNGDCDPQSDKARWSCCADKGGVFQCPSDRPFICASRTCRGDHCCRKDCFSTDTGLKPCAGPPGRRGAKGLLGAPGAPGEAGLIGEDGPAGPMGRVESRAKHFEAGVALSQLFAVLLCNVAFMSAVFCAASCSKQRDQRKLDTYS